MEEQYPKALAILQDALDRYRTEDALFDFLAGHRVADIRIKVDDSSPLR
jgi:hypothetical protein